MQRAELEVDILVLLLASRSEVRRRTPRARGRVGAWARGRVGEWTTSALSIGREGWVSGAATRLAEPCERADQAAQLRTVRVARLVAELVMRAVLGRPPDGSALCGEAAEQR